MSVRVLTGDVRQRLGELPDESVHCVVTSPPYWGLRDYGCDGQLGLEKTLGEHIANMVEVFAEVRRVLRSDGTLWLNYGDSYATSVNGRSAAATKAAGNDDRTFRDKPFCTVGPVYERQPESRQNARRGRSGNLGNGGINGINVPEGRIAAGGYLKPKDLCGVPWRVAFALQDDGWWLRQDIIWSKPNPMPESVTDRCTKAHEYLFLLAKSERYYFDQEAIRQPLSGASVSRYECPTPMTISGQFQGSPIDKRFQDEGKKIAGSQLPTTANKRSVWEIATAPFREAHFATFPPALVEPCILAGTSAEGVCGQCGSPWRRRTEQLGLTAHTGTTASLYDPRSTGGRISKLRQAAREAGGEYRGAQRRTLGWQPACSCNAGNPVPATVLDPFGGSGTVGMVADRLSRNAILIELNPEYAAMARRRIENDAGMFAEVAAQ